MIGENESAAHIHLTSKHAQGGSRRDGHSASANGRTFRARAVLRPAASLADPRKGSTDYRHFRARIQRRSDDVPVRPGDRGPGLRCRETGRSHRVGPVRSASSTKYAGSRAGREEETLLPEAGPAAVRTRCLRHPEECVSPAAAGRSLSRARPKDEVDRFSSRPALARRLPRRTDREYDVGGPRFAPKTLVEATPWRVCPGCRLEKRSRRSSGFADAVRCAFSGSPHTTAGGKRASTYIVAQQPPPPPSRRQAAGLHSAAERPRP